MARVICERPCSKGFIIIFFSKLHAVIISVEGES